MRVLFVTYAAKAHFQAMVPVGWALRAAGHDVRVASQPELIDIITETGLTAVSVGRDHHLWRNMNRLLSKRFAELRPDVHQLVRSASILPFDVVDEAPETITRQRLGDAYAALVQSWYRTVNNSMLGDLVEFTRCWQPDLVIWEPNTYVGAIAATLSGAAHARLLWGMDIFGVTRDRFLELTPVTDDGDDALAEWIGKLAVRHGGRFTEDMTVGHFTIDQLPDALRLPANLHYVRTRYVPYNGPAVVPSWLWDRPARPRVAVTLGVTSTEHFGGYGCGVQEILDALADLDVEVVATVPEKERQKLRRIPGNARVVEFVPLHALMPTCSAAIHHAGFGTLCSTLMYGVPVLSLPERFDEPLFARRIAEHGAGLSIPMAEATGELIRDRIVRLLGEPTYRHGAERLSAQMRALPAPLDLVRDLEELTARYRGR